ncbi:monovalent cation/H(+) antiporter subunit G [Gilvimarinus sp. F26214L]|uniref:monovalent cation/H(+) antiporter subunit G n=1 Tax=Gilvimarinus sp. DZF01 TaxID=3461371 RepID=UPI0040456089
MDLFTIISGICLALGSFLILTGGVGVLRFPDFYTRMHAAGITETLATGLILVGLMLLAGWSLELAKLTMILLFVLLTSPTASHALAKSARHGKLTPKLVDSEKQSS